MAWLIVFEVCDSGQREISVVCIKWVTFRENIRTFGRENETVCQIRVPIERGFAVSRTLLLTKLPKSRKWPQIAMFCCENVALLVSMRFLNTAFALD